MFKYLIAASIVILVVFAGFIATLFQEYNAEYFYFDRVAEVTSIDHYTGGFFVRVNEELTPPLAYVKVRSKTYYSCNPGLDNCKVLAGDLTFKPGDRLHVHFLTRSTPRYFVHGAEWETTYTIESAEKLPP